MSRQTINEQAERKARQVEQEKLTISFEFLDFENEYFFLGGLDSVYYQKLFRCLETLRNATVKEFASQTHPSLTVKSIFNTSKSLYPSFPQELVTRVKDRLFVESRDDDVAKSQAEKIVSTAFEVSVSKNYGRIHGFLWNTSFHLVWFDPAHNLYCGGRPKGLEFAAAVKGFTPAVTRKLQDQIVVAQNQLVAAQADIDALLS